MCVCESVCVSFGFVYVFICVYVCMLRAPPVSERSSCETGCVFLSWRTRCGSPRHPQRCSSSHQVSEGWDPQTHSPLGCPEVPSTHTHISWLNLHLTLTANLKIFKIQVVHPYSPGVKCHAKTPTNHHDNNVQHFPKHILNTFERSP